ncbi:RsmD family RNA methyltransferase [Spiroplasma endosymbiont of Polydrusus cervinus]|uniref:RsmD family RNA methyltransferase n=1 Tax=Spiroplasma endosymbiont of Polydrusus cervinus TaxID=3066287 RepID=UPI0030D3FC16
MRVISGKYKGYQIKTLEGMNTRPMAGRIKKDMFNILDNYFVYENKIGLDIFAGSGQLGIEGLSRGLQLCYFNDFNQGAYKIIETNLNKLKVDNAKLLSYDYQLLLNWMIQNKILIDILFLDPPFKQIQYYYDIITVMLNNNIIDNYGVIVCESNQALSFDQFNLVILRCKTYRKKYLYILRLEKGEN